MNDNLAFPYAQQAQIIRANQRDIYHVASLREQMETVLRAWLGTRRLSRWDKEVDVFIKLCYFGLTTGRATQTLGEEYTDIWQYTSDSSQLPPSLSRRIGLILMSTLPAYFLGKYGNSSSLNHAHPKLAKWVKNLSVLMDAATEVNLAIFYLSGTHYHLVKRLLSIQHISSIPQDPRVRSPSYSLLGIMIGIRLLHRLLDLLRSRTAFLEQNGQAMTRGLQNIDFYLDDRPIVNLLDASRLEADSAKPAEEDEGTALDISAIPQDIRSSRNCTLCLEERTGSTATECGHLFCWDCIVGWGREKAECPLCRQALALDKLLPIYNL